ncbi:bifunctional DnaQ family exonuclease/ATP-dependent helicase [Streptococcus hyovaginalis]
MDKTKPKYAVIDLEATGASITAKIIQVGIVILQEDEIIETYQTDVNPHEPLTDHITQLTGITDEQLALAPDFSQVARDIYHLISDCIFVAHNVKFDANLLAEHLFFEGYELRTPRVDTVELAQVFFPTFEKYSLGEVTKALGIPLEEAHTAIADAQATAQLFLRIKEKIRSLPGILLERLSRYADAFLFESRLIIDEIPLTKPLDANTHADVAGLVLRKANATVSEKCYSQDSSTNLALLGLEERDQQLAFSKAIEEAQRSKQKSHFIQAQSGIGKTYGYLIPLLANPELSRIVVSVPTKLLQDQIMSEEAKRLHQVFGTAIHSLKGPANYIKLDAFKASLDQEDTNRLLNRYKMQLLVWLFETEDGDLDAIKQQQRLQWYFDELRHDGNLSQASLFWDHDFWQRSYQKAQSSRLLITNHAYLLTRLEDDPSLIEGAQLVIDEAQKFFLALEAFSRSEVAVELVLTEIEERIAESSELLRRRLLESLQYELNQLVIQSQQTTSLEISPEKWQKISGDIHELEQNGLVLESMACFGKRIYDSVWLEVTNTPTRRQTTLKAGKESFLDFSKMLPEEQVVYFVSATLTISPDLQLPQLLGFGDYSQTVVAELPTDRQAIWVDQQSPDPHGDQDSYYHILTDRIMALAQLQKPMLILTTSSEALLELSQRLEGEHVPHLAQGKDGSNHQIKRRFESDKASILLGTGSFWEGVDFSSHDQLILVITRLPFENPQDFLHQKVTKLLSEKGKNPFISYSLPVMMMRLKQAMGRTSRRQQQQSAIILLDRRLMEKNYGPSVLTLLGGERPLYLEKSEKILSDVADFLL